MSAPKHGPVETPPLALGPLSEIDHAEPDGTERALIQAIRLGTLSIGGFVVLAFAMGALITVDGAVIAPGQVSTQIEIQQVSHPFGGVIASVLARDGDHVRRGQPLIRLDDSISGVGAVAAQQSVQQLLATSARLRAERDGSSEISFPLALLKDETPAAKLAMAEARQMLALRRGSEFSGRAQNREQLAQASLEIEALQVQADAARQQAVLIEPELAALRSLKERGLVTIGRLNQMERSAIELQSAIANFTARIAQARARMAEIRQAGIQAEQAARAAAAAELNPVLASLSDQNIRARSAQDALERSVIRAPHDGTVENLRFSTIGSVIPPGQPVVEIVPDGGSLTIDLRVAPQDVDAVEPDQIATVRFTGFPNNTAPELVGRITHLSSRRLIDDRTGENYYKATIAISDQEKARLGKNIAIVGMPVETYLQTGKRSLLSYLFSPLLVQFGRAFRE